MYSLETTHKAQQFAAGGAPLVAATAYPQQEDEGYCRSYTLGVVVAKVLSWRCDDAVTTY